MSLSRRQAEQHLGSLGTASPTRFANDLPWESVCFDFEARIVAAIIGCVKPGAGKRSKGNFIRCAGATILLAGCLPVVAADEPPQIPVGLEAYRRWDLWPYQRIGARAYMRSTYDRRGGNEGADASHFLYQLADDFNVALEVAGPGVLYFVRCNHWHGSPWHYEVDGVDHIIQETSSANPNKPVPNSVFLPENLFPNPLTWTWSITKGADLNWVPMPFEKNFRLAYSRTHYGTGYYIYQLYDRSAKLSQPIRSWEASNSPDTAVLELINRAGTDIAPRFDAPEGKRLGVLQQGGGPMSLGKDIVLTVQTIRPKSPAMLRALEFTVPREQAIEFGRARLRVTWDDLSFPAIYAPVALFFGAGTLYNRDDREYLVKGLPIHIRYDTNRVHLACYYPMPFFRSAKFELIGNGQTNLTGIRWSVQYHPYKDPTNHVAYFHATYRDHPNPEPGKDLVLLDTQEVEGGGDWSGNFVGTSWIFSHRAVLNTLEGDPRFFFDDSQTPQAYGTGTEEWGGGGDYWGGLNMTLPFAGHPVGARNEKEAKNDEDKIESAYRFLLADLFPFGKRAVIRLEYGGDNRSTEHYETVTYWYGVNSPTLVKTDEFRIGDPESEKAHGYTSPDASEPYEIISRYEWGPDTLDGKAIYPAHTDKGRKTMGESVFVLKLDQNNWGVLLRRKLDYSFPNQRAEVYVAEVVNAPEIKKQPLTPTLSSSKAGRERSAAATSVLPTRGAASPDTSLSPRAVRGEGQGEGSRSLKSQLPDWSLAGIWYLAGANTCVYSNPKEELGATQHIVQTSNRRFRDDEFLIPRELTRGRSAIRVRIQFKPVKIPLFPGHPLPELAWSEIRYDAYCWVMPKVTR